MTERSEYISELQKIDALYRHARKVGNKALLRVKLAGCAASFACAGLLAHGFATGNWQEVVEGVALPWATGYYFDRHGPVARRMMLLGEQLLQRAQFLTDPSVNEHAVPVQPWMTVVMNPSARHNLCTRIYTSGSEELRDAASVIAPSLQELRHYEAHRPIPETIALPTGKN